MELSDERSAEDQWWERVGMSVLLRAAFSSYGDVVRTSLAEAGFDDLSRNGAYVIGAVACGSLSVRQLPSALGVTKQSFSQLLDTLVLRGYVARDVDPEDRRRLRLTLTDRGTRLSELLDRCASRSDSALLDLVGEREQIATTRRVLARMTEIPIDLALER
ncbi:MarR family winged helix-turn-helix transcriptional regulator [uncultured Amnibacterium sp.]|uniref:MarR family winged helix-turn-helix transcriptional regulator n=1 Tax=uncultured Amnibacterium sp. TaxID=1631851 RepID=UPI0035CA8E69